MFRFLAASLKSEPRLDRDLEPSGTVHACIINRSELLLKLIFAGFSQIRRAWNGQQAQCLSRSYSSVMRVNISISLVQAGHIWFDVFN